METFVGEVLGTFVLILLGDGVVANVVLKDTKGSGAGWLTINTGWALAVFIAVALFGPVSGAHINPAVTFSLAVAGSFPWEQVPVYVAGQMLGAFLGGSAVWLFYKPHFERTEDADLKLAVFCTGPAIRNTPSNAISEVIGTWVLVMAVLMFIGPDAKLGALEALPIAAVVFGIGASLGGTTGYAINPARDLGPRIAHAVLPILGKRDSDWGYAWLPVVAPLIGGALAALTVSLIHA